MENTEWGWKGCFPWVETPFPQRDPNPDSGGMVLHVNTRVDVGGSQNGIVGCKPALAGIKRIIPLLRGCPLLTRVSLVGVSLVDACVGVPR